MLKRKFIHVLAVLLSAFSFLYAGPVSARQLHADGYELPRALESDGESGYVEFGELKGVTLNDEMSLEMWVLPRVHDNTNRRWLRWEGEGTYFEILQARTGWVDCLMVNFSPEEAGRVRVRSRGRVLDLLEPGEWVHVAFTAKTGESPLLYLNGEEIRVSASDIPEFSFEIFF